MLTAVLFVLLAICYVAFKLYDRLADLRNQLDAAKSQIDSQAKHRLELLRQLQSAMPGPSPAAPSLVGKEAHRLLEEIHATEEKIEFAKRYYNEMAEGYGKRLRIFPYSLIAGTLGLQPRDSIELTLND